MPLKSRKGPTADRKTPEKEQFLIEHYNTMSRKELAQALHESPRWVKRQLRILASTGKITHKNPPPEITLNESAWSENIKQRAIELRTKYLKPTHFITKALKKEFNFDINTGALQYWFDKFGTVGKTKQEWLKEYLSKELAIELLDKSYFMIDISNYLKEKHDVYVSDDLILTHMQKMDLPSQKLKRIADIRAKAQTFSKEWLNQEIQAHSGLRILGEKMGVSKTVIMNRLNEENLSLIKHRKIWSLNLENLRDNLLKIEPIPAGSIPKEDIHQMFLGWLAGDGHLDTNGRFVVNHSLAQLDYICLKAKILGNNLSNICTVPQKVSDKYYGGKEQINLSFPNFERYCEYLNEDGSKNYEKILSELNPLGWACYFMDDGSFYNTDSIKTIMSMHHKLADKFENKFMYGKKIQSTQLEIKGIDSQYIIPGMQYKINKPAGEYWEKYYKDLFNPTLKCDLDLCFVNTYTIDRNPLLLHDTINYYHKRGFPYFKISDDYIRKEFSSLLSLDTSYFWRDTSVLKYITTGNSIFKHFMPHMVEAKYRGVSPIKTFDNYQMFLKVIEYTLKRNKSILPDYIYESLIYFNGGVVGFPCTVAKAIVTKFTNKDDIVVDPCAGWGGRLLGTKACDRQYFGFEPWEKTYVCLNEMSKFLNLTNVAIENSNFNLGKAPNKCHLIFTSPPYIDLEIYGKPLNIENWKELMRDIFKYAENCLIPGGHLILNISRNLKALLPETNLNIKEPLYWYTSTRKRNIEEAEILYIWSK